VLVPIHQPNQTDIQNPENPTTLKRLDPCGAFVCEISPDPPCAFALFKSDNRWRPGVASANKMQDHVLACALCVCEVIEIYDAAVRCAHKIHGQY
jgi:hypothetical protein